MKMRLTKVVTVGILSLLGCVAQASSGGSTISFGKPTIDHNDQFSLQRGARTYMNYCSGCHSLQYMRYNRMAKDIGITDGEGNVAEGLLKDNLIFNDQKSGEHIKVAMQTADAAQWFGAPPPDLTLEARLRGTNWLYNYLLAFYRDESRPWGVNNAVFKDVGMPHMLADLQGVQEPVYRVKRNPEGEEEKTIVGMKLVEHGKLTSSEYKEVVNDLVNFLSYTANPVKEQSKRIGLYVLLFLSVLFVLSWALKREYWKDVH